MFTQSQVNMSLVQVRDGQVRVFSAPGSYESLHCPNRAKSARWLQNGIVEVIGEWDEVYHFTGLTQYNTVAY